ncbi:AAA family ATPase [Candidatus Woesearchaeota archaeon]|nr:AAA family ATPase [Candidatus Woesearchaeota archaeon]
MITKFKTEIFKILNKYELEIGEAWRDIVELHEAKDADKPGGPKNFSTVSIEELAHKDFGEYKYLVKGLIPREGITILSASPKSGKSWFVLYVALNLSRGTPVFELETIRSQVLFVDEENTLRGLKRRLDKLTDDLGGVDIKFLNKQGFKVDNEADREWLKKYVENNSIDLVIFDSSRRVHNKEENTSDGIAEVYDCLKDLMTTGVAVILIDHNRKLGQFEKVSMESIRGSSDKYAMAESIIMLQTKEIDGKTATGKVKRTIIMPELRESSDLTNFAVNWYDNEDGSKIVFDYQGPVQDVQLKKDRAVELIMQIVEEDNQKQTVKMLEVKLKPQGIGQKSIKEALRELTSNGQLMETKGTAKFWNTSYFSKPENSLLGSNLYNTAKLPSNSEESSSLE